MVIKTFTGIKSEMNKLASILVLMGICFFVGKQMQASGIVMPGPYEDEVYSATVVDTIPLKDRTGDFINDKSKINEEE